MKSKPLTKKQRVGVVVAFIAALHLPVIWLATQTTVDAYGYAEPSGGAMTAQVILAVEAGFAACIVVGSIIASIVVGIYGWVQKGE